jgi:hypothetical protein
LVIAAAWVAAVAAAAVFGVAAVAALAGTGAGTPLSQREVSDRLAQTSSPAPGGSTGGGQSAPLPSTSAGARQYFATSGGGVWASCSGDLATLQSTPRPGYRLDGSQPGPAPSAWVKFKLDVRRGHSNEYMVTVTCAGGVPRMTETSDD